MLRNPYHDRGPILSNSWKGHFGLFLTNAFQISPKSSLDSMRGRSWVESCALFIVRYLDLWIPSSSSRRITHPSNPPPPPTHTHTHTRSWVESRGWFIMRYLDLSICSRNGKFSTPLPPPGPSPLPLPPPPPPPQKLSWVTWLIHHALSRSIDLQQKCWVCDT